ncbi:hypothetical protein SLE2022_320890 [Rubroshorea leprosula]
MMNKMGFSEKWRKWIQECLKTASISVLINGSPSQQIKMSKGLRQGDPLSPFLFLLVAEGLNGLIMKAVSKGLLEGIKVGKGELSISHLQFADDTLIMGEAKEENIWAVKYIMRSFELVSGLKINYAKSQLMGVNVEEEWLTRMASLLNCKIGSIPFKYLGTWVGGNPRNIMFWRELIESFEKKLAKWKGKYVSTGGRITLINSVLSSLPVFQMSTHLLPKGTLSLLDKIRKQFLWGRGEGGKKKINWVKWEVVCKGKEEGGLGIKELRSFNMALLGKWWVKMADGSSSLWSRVIREKYGDIGRHWRTWFKEGKGRGSIWWQNICKINDMAAGKEGWLENNVQLSLGEGKQVSFWSDKWVGIGVLSNLFPRLHLLSTGRQYPVNEMGIWEDGRWRWNLKWKRDLREWEKVMEKELLDAITPIQPNQGNEDKWLWILDSKAGYSTKSAYQFLTSRPHRTEEVPYKKIWNPLVPNKICTMVWQLVQNRIPTKFELFKRGVLSNESMLTCAMCEEDVETSNHLFLHCQKAYNIWGKCLKWWGISSA